MTGTPAPGIATRPRRGMAAAAFALAFAVALLPGAAALSASAALFAFAPTAAAQASDPAPLRFRDGAEEARFHALVSQLRCVMCQNQSLADSDAQIARDLRAQVLQLMREGRSDDEIEAYLVERYSDFVLYRPPMKPSTWLLWFGPALLLLAGGVAVARIVRRHGPGNDNGSTEANDGQEW